MRAVVYERFGEAPRVADLPDPMAPDDGVVVRVGATGLCRSDWHGWQGHDDDIRSLPHVPGHEFAGTIIEVGRAVTRWNVGDRVTMPFVNACGACATCSAGHPQVCPNQWQPGFHGQGTYAELVALPRADPNLIAVPDTLTDVAAAALGCRIGTAYRAVALVGQVQAGEDVVIIGCGGVGLAAVMIAATAGARVVAIDPSERARGLAGSLGAVATYSSTAALTDLAPHVTIDAFGDAEACRTAIRALRPRGRHVQVGLLPGVTDAVPMSTVIAHELQVLGSHGLAAADYPGLMTLVETGAVRPDALVTRVIGLDDVAAAWVEPGPPGMTVIDPGREHGSRVVDRSASR